MIETAIVVLALMLLALLAGCFIVMLDSSFDVAQKKIAARLVLLLPVWPVALPALLVWWVWRQAEIEVPVFKTNKIERGEGQLGFPEEVRK